MRNVAVFMSCSFPRVRPGIPLSSRFCCTGRGESWRRGCIGPITTVVGMALCLPTKTSRIEEEQVWPDPTARIRFLRISVHDALVYSLRNAATPRSQVRQQRRV
jgi:hypothetical protein